MEFSFIFRRLKWRMRRFHFSDVSCDVIFAYFSAEMNRFRREWTKALKARWRSVSEMDGESNIVICYVTYFVFV